VWGRQAAEGDQLFRRKGDRRTAGGCFSWLRRSRRDHLGGGQKTLAVVRNRWCWRARAVSARQGAEALQVSPQFASHGRTGTSWLTSAFMGQRGHSHERSFGCSCQRLRRTQAFAVNTNGEGGAAGLPIIRWGREPGWPRLGASRIQSIAQATASPLPPPSTRTAPAFALSCVLPANPRTLCTWLLSLGLNAACIAWPAPALPPCTAGSNAGITSASHALGDT